MRLREIPIATALFVCRCCSAPRCNLTDKSKANTGRKYAEEDGERVREYTEVGSMSKNRHATRPQQNDEVVLKEMEIRSVVFEMRVRMWGRQPRDGSYFPSAVCQTYWVCSPVVQHAKSYAIRFRRGRRRDPKRHADYGTTPLRKTVDEFLRTQTQDNRTRV
jgi:hypothetical protein